MLPLHKIRKTQKIDPSDLSILLESHYAELMSSFYETQSEFLVRMYKKYNSIETAHIILCFSRNVHLEIIRQREKNLNFDVSLDKFWENFQTINKPIETIASIVKMTLIPKETVRRKINKLVNENLLSSIKNAKGFSLKLLEKDKDLYFEHMEKQIESFSKFISKFAKHFDTNLNLGVIKKEIVSEFSFYWYHFLSCQLNWLKMWQGKINDNNLLIIILQTVIPTLQYANKKIKNDISVDKVFQNVGEIPIPDLNFSECGVNATTVSDITGIPRATCIRKLDKLVSLGFLVRQSKTKRYSVNQDVEGRTKNITTKSNVIQTIKIFSEYLSIIMNSLLIKKK